MDPETSKTIVLCTGLVCAAVVLCVYFWSQR